MIDLRSREAAVIAFVALGANLGDRAGNIFRAIEMLRRTDGIEVVRESSLLENPAIGGAKDSPDFLNGVVEIRTTLSARAALNRLLEIEKSLGRVRREKWGPRVIDLDLLLFGDQIIDELDLKIPHPRMHERRFVLQPLAQIAPQLFHPVLKRSIADLLAQL